MKTIPGMRHPPLANGWIERTHQRYDIGDLQLESGEVLRDAFVTYVIHGDPARLRQDAILVNTAIGSTHHRLDFMIGDGAPLDTSRWCVVAVDALGNGLSSSPSNSAEQARDAFPRFTIRDMVNSQRLLLDHLGVEELAAVVGASMGGMQAVQWAVSHPERVKALVAIVPMARTSRWSRLVNEMSRRALFTDAACHRPRHRSEAMALWVPLTQAVMSRSPTALEFNAPFEGADWLVERERFLAEHGPDPFDWCYQTWAYDDHDVGQTPGCEGSTTLALQLIRAATLVVAPRLDLYNPVFAAKAMADGIEGASYVELPGDEGHACAAGDGSPATDQLRTAVGDFLRLRATRAGRQGWSPSH